MSEIVGDRVLPQSLGEEALISSREFELWLTRRKRGDQKAAIIAGDGKSVQVTPDSLREKVSLAVDVAGYRHSDEGSGNSDQASRTVVTTRA